MQAVALVGNVRDPAWVVVLEAVATMGASCYLPDTVSLAFGRLVRSGVVTKSVSGEPGLLLGRCVLALFVVVTVSLILGPCFVLDVLLSRSGRYYCPS